MKKTRQQQRLEVIASIIMGWRDVPDDQLQERAKAVNSGRGWTYDVRWVDGDYVSENSWTRVEGDVLKEEELAQSVEMAKRWRKMLAEIGAK